MTDLILPLEKQVSLLESSKILKELGVPQRSLFYWTIGDNYFIAQSRLNGLGYSAFTVAELGEFLKADRSLDVANYGNAFKESLPEWSEETKHWCAYKNGGGIANDENEAEARAKMLIYLLKNKLIEVPK